MMLTYILKLIVLVPLVGALAFGALWLWRKAQPGMMGFSNRERAVKIVDALPLGATGRLAVVEFGGRRLLVAVSRSGVQLLTEAGHDEAAANG
jgi:flagellar protein FliO/FliZ